MNVNLLYNVIKERYDVKKIRIILLHITIQSDTEQQDIFRIDIMQIFIWEKLKNNLLSLTLMSLLLIDSQNIIITHAFQKRKEGKCLKIHGNLLQLLHLTLK